jgi:hypothetical protein
MRLPHEKDNKDFKNYVAQVENSPFTQIQVIEVEIPYKKFYTSYCWKAAVVGETVSRFKNKLKVLYWSDSSARPTVNPFDYAKKMWKESIGFSATLGSLGMGENTLPATYDFLNMDINDYKNYTEIAATYFMMNIGAADGVAKRVLREWVDCAVNHCLACMAPSCEKGVHGERKGAPNTVNVAHRQDQSVLGLLVYQAINRKEGNFQITPDRKQFMNISKRGVDCLSDTEEKNFTISWNHAKTVT